MIMLYNLSFSISLNDSVGSELVDEQPRKYESYSSWCCSR